MADLVLTNGRVALIDDDDLAWAQGFSWRAWRHRPHQKERAVCDVQVRGRVYRLHLLREIAARANARLAAAANRLRVSPKNGDWFDARRANLDITLKPRRQGRPKSDPRPKGSLSSRTRTHASEPARKIPSNLFSA